MIFSGIDQNRPVMSLLMVTDQKQLETAELKEQRTEGERRSDRDQDCKLAESGDELRHAKGIF